MRGAYFIGKVVWAKGYTELLDLMAKHSAAYGDVAMDCYGTGEDLEAVAAEAAQRRLGLRFHGAKDHLDRSMHEYQVGAGAWALLSARRWVLLLLLASQF